MTRRRVVVRILLLLVVPLVAFFARGYWVPFALTTMIGWSGGSFGGDEITADLAYIAGFTANERTICRVLDQVAVNAGPQGNEQILDGYLRGLVKNGGIAIRDELLWQWMVAPEPWARRRIALAVKTLGLTGTTGIPVSLADVILLDEDTDSIRLEAAAVASRCVSPLRQN